MLLFSHLLLHLFENSIDTGGYKSSCTSVWWKKSRWSPPEMYRTLDNFSLKTHISHENWWLEDDSIDSFPFNTVPFQGTHVYLPGTPVGQTIRPISRLPQQYFGSSSGTKTALQAVTLSLPCVMARLLATRRLHSFFQPLRPECCNHIHSRQTTRKLKSWYHTCLAEESKIFVKAHVFTLPKTNSSPWLGFLLGLKKGLFSEAILLFQRVVLFLKIWWVPKPRTM